ncbi:MAG: ArsR/SmtB family transcription factor [Candidatus Helarchaeota archaeon]
MNHHNKRIWKHLTDEEFHAFLKIKAHKLKQKIIELLINSNEPLYQAQIAKKLKKTSSGIKFHLNELIKMNMIEKYRDGRYLFYKLSENGLKIYDTIKEYI